MRTFPHDPAATSLASALHRLQTRSWGVRAYHEALRKMRTLPARYSE